MKRVAIFNKKQLLLAILLVSISAIAHAQTYTSTATSGAAVDATWDNGSPVSKDSSTGTDVYTFFDGHEYKSNTSNLKLINTTGRDIKVLSDGTNGVTFTNWQAGNKDYLVSGKSVELGDNITFSGTTGTAVYALNGDLKIGNNVSIIGSVNEGYTPHYGGGISVVPDKNNVAKVDIGDNFVAQNNILRDSSVSPFKGGGAIGIHYSADMTVGNNAVFEGNQVVASAIQGVAMGGAISGLGNQENITAHHNLTFNGSVVIRNNSAISQGTLSLARGGAIGFVKANGTPRKTATLTFNGGNGTVEISGNTARSSNSSYGGALSVGDGDVYIAATNIIIKNNLAENTVGNFVFGGAIYVSSSDLNSGGNLSILGNATITGNVAKGGSAAVGGAIFADGNITLKPNAVGNEIVFRDNKAANDGAAIQLNRVNKTLLLDYGASGQIKVYDNLNVINGSSLMQRGNGTTSIWAWTHGGSNAQIESGRLILSPEVTMPDTVTGVLTTYSAGTLTGQNVTIGTVGNPGAIIDIHEGAELEGGYNITGGGQVNINDNNIINLYGNGSINLSVDTDFNRFGADSSKVNINVGNNNTINLAARTAEQIAANTYNIRGTDGTTKFSALHLASMGNGNTFTINSNIAINQADKLVVRSTAAGQNYIKIGYDPTILAGGNAVATTKTLVVEAAAGSSSANLLGTFTGAASDVGVRSWTPNVKQDGNDWYIVGNGSKSDEPSTTVKTSKTMTHALMSTFRLINNDLLKRMGELRFNPNNAGVWLRTYTGESDLKGGGNQRYTVIQGGVDKLRQEKTGKRFTGIALEHIHSANKFDRGSGTTKMYDIGLYQSWLADSGHYYDIVGKVYKTSNSMNIVDSNGVPAQGDYKGWAYGVSMEYGYRKELGKGYFAIPQIEFTYRHVGGVNYATSNNIDITQKAYDSLVGRAGITIGRKYNNESQVYMTANVMREFIANTKMSAIDTLGGSFRETLSGKETWYNLAIGATIKNGKKNDWYMELERDFGSSCNNKWQVLLGTRWSW